MTDAFIKSGSKLHNYNHDFNGANQEGIGYYQVTQKKGKRWSVAKAYLDPIKHRPNLTILTEVPVDKLIIKDQTELGIN